MRLLGILGFGVKDHSHYYWYQSGVFCGEDLGLRAEGCLTLGERPTVDGANLAQIHLPKVLPYWGKALDPRP